MTIAPISTFGNTPASLMGNAQGSPISSGGFASFFATLLGGSAEGAGTEGDISNLDGLLNLLGGEEVPLNEDLGSMLKAFLPEGALEGLSQEAESLTQFLQPLVDGQATLPQLLGEHADGQVVYEKLIVEIRKTVVQLQSLGADLSSITDGNSLAKAYEKLGLPAEEALEKATNVEAAIAIMKDRFDIEIAGKEQPDMISTIFNMAANQSDAFNANFTMTQANIQLSQSVVAFEASSVLSTGDIGMAVLKGETLSGFLSSGKTIGEDSDSTLQKQSLSTPVNGKESTAKPFIPAAKTDILTAEFKPLTAKDIPVTRPAATTSVEPSTLISQGSESIINAKSTEVSQGIFASSALKMAEDERSQVKRQVTDITADKVLKPVKAEMLFTVKPQIGSEDMNLELETVDGETVDLEDIDGSFEEVMDLTTRRTSLDARVEGRSQQAMTKQANIASQVDIQMKSLIKQGGGEIRFRLDPPELGELDIKLKISQGTVRGTIIVQTVEAAEYLARDLRILQQSFQEAGLELHENGIQFQLQDERSQEQQTAGRGGQGSGAEENEDDFLDIASIKNEPSGWVKADSIVDVSI